MNDNNKHRGEQVSDKNIEHEPRVCTDCNKSFTPPPYDALAKMKICEECAWIGEGDFSD